MNEISYNIWLWDNSNGRLYQFNTLQSASSTIGVTLIDISFDGREITVPKEGVTYITEYIGSLSGFDTSSTPLPLTGKERNCKHYKDIQWRDRTGACRFKWSEIKLYRCRKWILCPHQDHFLSRPDSQDNRRRDRYTGCLVTTCCTWFGCDCLQVSFGITLTWHSQNQRGLNNILPERARILLLSH